MFYIDTLSKNCVLFVTLLLSLNQLILIYFRYSKILPNVVFFVTAILQERKRINRKYDAGDKNFFSWSEKLPANDLPTARSIEFIVASVTGRFIDYATIPSFFRIFTIYYYDGRSLCRNQALATGRWSILSSMTQIIDLVLWSHNSHSKTLEYTNTPT